MVELLIVVAIIMTIVAIAIPSYSEMVNAAHVVAAIGDIKHIQYDIYSQFVSSGVFPESFAAAKIENPLDPWGVPYQYLKIDGAQKKKGSGSGKGGGGGGGGDGCRKDKNLHPLNSDFDLYSKGRDKDSQLPITAHSSRDDIIRANNGGFIGLASSY